MTDTFDRYVDRDTAPEAIVKLTYADIEGAIAYMDDQIDVKVAEDAAREIMREARRRVLQAAIDNGEDVVLEEWGCPRCEERRADELVWLDDGETIECATCGATYTLD